MSEDKQSSIDAAVSIDAESDKETSQIPNGNSKPVTEPTDYEDIFFNYDELERLCQDNINYFKDDQSSKGQRLHGAFVGLTDHIESSKTLVKKICSFVRDYDFDEKTPGNGYRSFVVAVGGCLKHTIRLATSLIDCRKSLLFRKGWFMREVESCNHLLASLSSCLTFLTTLQTWSEPGDLFPNTDRTAVELLDAGDTINQYCFYGRCLGFQFCDSMKGVLKFIAICMAGFSESYYSQAGLFAKTTSSVWTSGKYFLYPELRARRIVNISQNASVEFCKAFWFLAESELMHTIPSFVGSPVKVNRVISMAPEKLKLRTVEGSAAGEFIDIPIPMSHLGVGPIRARLLSSVCREGMIGAGTETNKLPSRSKGLIFHCHGGGFVAQSSKSHELYLRDWAIALDVPILSIDYSLAPKAPFPRALEEVFYAYCWALLNTEIFGSTGETIVLAGDSAGANLNIGLTLKCIENKIRKPDGLFLAYVPTLISFTPSPARLLCLMDPILPFGFMMRCLKAYACPSAEILEENKRIVSQNDEIQNANNNFEFLSFDCSSQQNDNKKNSSTSPRPTKSVSSAENSNWEHLDLDENTMKSAISDEISDTFASAAYHSQTVENTDLISPDASSCISFEEDSQPIGISVEPVNTTTEKISQESNNKLDKSQCDTYVTEFLEKYVLDTASEVTEDFNSKRRLRPSIPKTFSEENIIYDAGKDILLGQPIKTRINQAAQDVVSAVSSTINKLTNSSEIRTSASPTEDQKNFDALIARSPSDEFIFEVPKDPYLSPYFADDEVLSQLPATKILTVEMDPCLDDCVMFAKKLKRLGVPIGLDILKGLPHGFLNFSMLSKEAFEGSQVCIKRINELLGSKPEF